MDSASSGWKISLGKWLWATRELFKVRLKCQYRTTVVNFNGRFHTRGQTKCLDGQIVSDEQIVWCTSDVQTGRTNFSTNKSSEIYRSEKTIFPIRRSNARRFLHPDDLFVLHYVEFRVVINVTLQKSILFTRWLIWWHVAIVFPIKTFRKPLKIMQDHSKTMVWHIRW